MTKRNLTLGNASGKLGSVVYMRRRGQQVARVLVPSPRDPKSERQGVARAHFANYVNLWRLLGTYIFESWIGVSRYGTRANAFYKMNVGRMPAISKSMSRSGYAYPNLGLLTYGNLPVSYRYEYATTEVATAPDGQAPALAWSGNALGSSASTWGDVSAALIKANNGLREGDEIHFLIMMYTLDFDYSGDVPAENNPYIVHYAANLDLSDDKYVEDMFYFLQFKMLPAVQNFQQIAFSPSSSLYSALGEYYGTDVALASWVVRASEKGSARFTRSSFVMSGDNRNMLRAFSAFSPGSRAYGDTFRNI